VQAALRPANRVQLSRIAGEAQAAKFAEAEGEGGVWKEGGVLAVREGHIWGFLRKVRTAQNSPPGFCAARTEFGKVSIQAQFERAPVKIFHWRGSVWVVKELVH
jgi:hypothetical protein